MKKRRSPNRRNDRPGEPHSRIPDAIYYELLPYVTPIELKLWLALKSREWRKDGTRKGLIRKSLRRISNDIAMPWSTTRKAFNGLRLKGLAEWAGAGIRLLEPRFTTSIPTGVTTSVPSGGRRTLGESGHMVPRGGHHRTQRWAPNAQEGHLVPFPSNGIDHGRSDLTIRHASVASSRAVDVPNGNDSRAHREDARASARGSRALSRESSKRKERGTVQEEERPLTREEARAALAKVKLAALAAAEDGTAKLRAQRDEQDKREHERRELLRQQAAELGKEGT